MSGLALLPASLLFGALMQGFGAVTALSVAASFALLASALLAALPLGRPHQPRSQEASKKKR